ncbi:MAG: ABC transporter substrate-binding protein [Coriobacteriales bacterium]|jgi:branched-chain amino acid transport system substrate-binding protein|nr:ABC transporter substrate-binding protein [Coriobacteriales bacterium]
MKKRLLVCLLALVLAMGMLTAAGCRRDEGSTDTGGQTATSDTILIGGAMSITGIQAPLDAPAVEGIQVAVDEINANGGINGKQLEFLNIDSKSDPATASEVAKQLIDQGAVAIITASDYDFGGPAARAAQEAGIVGISPSASSPLFGSAMLGDKQFTLSMWNTTMGAVMAELAYKDQGYRSVYVVTDDFIDYTKSLSRYFVESFEQQGGTVMLEDVVSQGKIDTAALLAHYRSLSPEPDFIYISSYMPDLGTMIKEFRAAGINKPVYGGDAYDDPALFELLGSSMGNDVLYDTHSYLSEAAVPGFDAYNALYKAKFGSDVEAPWSMAGYDVVMVLAEAIRETGETDGATMAKYMEEHEFNLLTGALDWSDAASGHEPDKAAAVVELQGGETNFLGWKKPDVLPRP